MRSSRGGLTPSELLFPGDKAGKNNTNQHFLPDDRQPLHSPIPETRQDPPQNLRHGDFHAREPVGRRYRIADGHPLDGRIGDFECFRGQ